MKKNKTLILLAGFVFGFSLISSNVFADDEFNNGFVVSPMEQEILLVPGESTQFTVTVSNPYGATNNLHYQAEISPFNTDTSYTDGTINFEEVTSYNEILNWVTMENATGFVEPNETATITCTVNVPIDAPGGGQYMSINISRVSGDIEQNSVNVVETMQIASRINASIAGEVIETGEIISTKIPSFNFSSPLNTIATTKNTGNVHQTATYTLEVFPLFSDEEIYSNAENPDTKTIIPDQTYAKNISWDNAPSVGIFKVRQTVTFAGSSTTTEKIVVICPLWLLFVIVFAVVLAVFYLVSRAKSRKKRQAE